MIYNYNTLIYYDTAKVHFYFIITKYPRVNVVVKIVKNAICLTWVKSRLLSFRTVESEKR